MHRFYPQARVVTAAIDNVLVRQAADVTRHLVFDARINHVGRSPVEVGIRVPQTGEPGNQVARSWVRDAAVSLELPALEFVDETDQKPARKALARREEYKRPEGPRFWNRPAVSNTRRSPSCIGPRTSRVSRDSWWEGCRPTPGNGWSPRYENVPQKIFGGYASPFYGTCQVSE